jgi:hypothetical protein
MDLTCVCCNVMRENFAKYSNTSSKTLNLCKGKVIKRWISTISFERFFSGEDLPAQL